MKERFETFTVLMNRINRNIRRIKNQEMKEYGLRSVHISCLYYLFREKEMTATKLCEHCEEDKATISRALLYLEKQGFLFARDPGKWYKAPLILTEKGKEAGEKISVRIECVLDAVSRGLTDNERLSLYKGLSAISRGLEVLVEEDGEE